MKITFNTRKDQLNRLNHGVPLALAGDLIWDEAIAWQDKRQDYGEVRMVALVPLSDRLYRVVYTDRADSRRIISLHKANKRDIKCYVRETFKN